MQGRFEIVTLSGSFLNYEVNGSINRSGSLSVALAGSDGRILGGCVVGALVAATQVQVQEHETFFICIEFVLCSFDS